jgi:ssDNA-binding Zn-finger/Zn-ribbon topoisomerase 1
MQKNKYLLGCCNNPDCTEYKGGWKYPLNYPEEDQQDCYCPSCGESLEFIVQKDNQ